MRFFLLIGFAYVLGSIPFGLIITKLFTNVDIKKEGSGNIGASNVKRVAGTKFALLTLFFDMLKGYLPTLFASFLMNPYFTAIVGFFALLGHLFSLFLKGRGGKGVATLSGVFLFISPLSLFFAFILYVTVILVTKISSLASIMASLSLILFLYIGDLNRAYLYLSLIGFILIVYRHKSNIKRLLEGKELKIF